MENSIVFPQNLKIELLYDLAILCLGAYPKESRSESGREMWATIFPEALFTTAKCALQQNDCPPMNRYAKHGIHVE